MESGQRVEAVEKALSILDAFSEDRMSLSLSEIAQETGISKSSLPRLLNSLILFGFIVRDPAKRYALGSNVWRLGALFRRRFDLGEKVRPELRQLVELTGETASYYVREQEERICLYRQNSPNPVRHHLDEGSRLSIDRGAAGHALSAEDSPPDRVFVSVGERNPRSRRWPFGSALRTESCAARCASLGSAPASTRPPGPGRASCCWRRAIG